MHNLETLADRRERLMREHLERNYSRMRKEFWNSKNSRLTDQSYDVR